MVEAFDPQNNPVMQFDTYTTDSVWGATSKWSAFMGKIIAAKTKKD